MNKTHHIKRIALFGSTGSVGTQALQVIAQNPDKFSAEVLTCNGNDSSCTDSAMRPIVSVVAWSPKTNHSGIALSGVFVIDDPILRHEVALQAIPPKR